MRKPNFNDGDVYVKLRIAHDELDPIRITELMSHQPSKFFRKGDPNPSYKKHVPYGFGAWYLESKGSVNSKELNPHILWLLDKLEGRRSILRGLRAQEYRVDISVFWKAELFNTVLGLSVEAIEKLATFDIGLLYFDVYF